MTEGSLSGRLKVLASVLAFFFAAMTTRLWFLQVMAANDYEKRAESNLLRWDPVPAARGKILDRGGEELVTNRPSWVVTVEKHKVRNPEALLLRLSEVLHVPARELGERLDNPDYGPYQSVPILEDATDQQVTYLEEHEREFPGVGYQKVGLREYPFGSLAAHVLGYLGEIGPNELGTPAFDDYRPGQLVGRGGVEQRYESWLHGKDGFEALEVDALGAETGRIIGRKRPIPGDDLVLTIQHRVQQVAESSLREGVRAAKQIVHEESGNYLRAPAGAVVVLDPKNGEIMAMASYPTYDPRVFYEGLSQREWERLNNPARNYPLNNRAIQAAYPPGSTLKPFVAAAAVKAGYASPNGFYPCPAEFTVPGDTSGTVFHNWRDFDSGVISFAQSLIDSCDTVFYQFGLEFYRERKIHGELLQQLMRAWGFDRPTGVDLNSEVGGRVPDVAWKAKIHERYPSLYPDAVWYPGDTINMSIGQGDLLVTPLQLAAAFGSLTNGGTLQRPHIGLRIQSAEDGRVLKQFSPNGPIGRVPFDPGTLGAIRAALQHVPSSGTAAGAFAGFPLSSVPVAGKTGTAEVAGEQPHSWFAAAAPAGNPEYVVVAVVEEGGHGSEVAAPIVRRILEGLFGLRETAFHVGPAAD
jgi:penicillin-binding protein 2